MALGKGLGSLIPPQQSPTNIANSAAASKHTHAQDPVNEVAIGDISVNPYQPRRHFAHDELEELISSIKQYGVLQPLLVSPKGDAYELIAGERRLRASKMAGRKTVPVIVRDVDDLEKIELALIENIQRSDLNPIEKSESYRKLINEFGLNHEEAAKKLGISRSSFSNSLRLLDLPGSIQKALGNRKITEGHAKILLGLPDKAKQLEMVQEIMDAKLSVSAFGKLVQGTTKQSRRPASTAEKLPHIADMENNLSEQLSTKVKIQHKGKTGGSITIQYYSAEELAAFIKRVSR